ncbi:hypothetical protein VKT23_003096 [Stygiomarasmius scandens]|uniref:Uncharacterized protein n=1 Tax=Marasmiellus scandens TaxID=2682957 RepID=A0ABR1JYJ2_9AGAR
MSNATTAPRSKTTRSSIRQSLNFASVGKAFADTFNKEKEHKSSKDSRRLSAVAAPLDPRPSPPPSKRSRTPETKTITTRRRSSLATASHRGVSLDDPSLRATPPSAVARPAALKPRPGASSNLPKYRPKSIIIDGQRKPPASPTSSRTSSRKRTSISEDESDDAVMIDKKDSENLQPASADRSTRAISPLPQRAAFKVNLTNITPSTATSPATPTKTTKHKRELSTPTATSAAKSPSPNRLIKAVKAASTIPRPSSSSSSVSGPSTPKGSPAKNSTKNNIFRSAKHNGTTDSSTESSSRSHSGASIPESPLVRHVRNRSKNETPTQQDVKMTKASSSRSPPKPSSDEEDEEDVEILLAPTTNLAAPTPAMPRITASRTRNRLAPQTPTKPVMPSNKDGSPSSLRPNPSPNSHSETRGSILSWDQLASEGSRTVPIDELGNMLSEMPAPFTAPISPLHTGGSMLLDPPSPTLSALNSPVGYGGSISQVLLPNVTPSPAVPRIGRGYYKGGSEDTPPAEGNSGTVTLLRLQLSSAESMAKERLKQLQSLEEELHNVKQARNRDVEELSHQLAILEERMMGSLQVREKTDEEKERYARELEARLETAKVMQEQAVREAVEQAIIEARESAIAQARDEARREARKQLNREVQRQKKTWGMECVAGSAKREWEGVKDECEGELERLNGEREMLKVLLAELDLAQQQAMVVGV